VAPEFLNTLAGGGIAVVGAMLGAWWTTRHAARDRHRRARQEMLRVARRTWDALNTEEVLRREAGEAEDAEHQPRKKPSGDDESFEALLKEHEVAGNVAAAHGRLARAESEVDHLADELAILALDLRRRTERAAVEVCVDALRERVHMGPQPAVPGRRAIWIIEQAVKVSVDRRVWRRRALTKNGRDALDDLSQRVAIVHEMHEENARAYEEWEREQRKHQQSEGQSGEGT
jgi:hypothetical protein